MSFKGRIFSIEHRLKLSIAKKGKKLSPLHRRRISIGNTGKKRSIEARRKSSLAQKGKPRPYTTGALSPYWKGGITSINARLRNSLDYKKWREAVFKRDNWTCQGCGKIGGTLNAHHIQPFSSSLGLRLVLGNGQTLCTKCHKKTDTYLNNRSTKKHAI